MPVSFFVFSQLPNHAHNCLVQSLYKPVCLGVVGHGLQSFDAKDLAQFLIYTTGEASTSIAQEPGQGPKDRNVTSMVFTVSSGVTYANTCLVKWSWKTKTLATLGK